MSDDFGLIKQKLLIEYMLADESVFSRCRNILKPTYFDPELKDVVDAILKHSDEYNALPTVSQISAEVNTLLDIVPGVRDQDQSWALNNIERFCQQGAIIEAVQASPDHIEAGNYGTVESMIREAVLVGLQKDLGTNYFKNPRERLERIKQKNLIPTGWRDIDRKLYGGLNRGEITIFTAGSGVGKSLFLQNACLNWIGGVTYSWQDGKEEQKYDPMNVIYITLELSEDLTSKRLDSMVTGIDAREIFKRIDEVETAVAIKGKKSGSFLLKYMPSGSTATDVKAYLKEYETQMGFKPDAVAIDYLDEMGSVNRQVKIDNMFIKDQAVTAELRELAVEMDIILITASQLNRSAVDESEQTQAMIGGGISKIQKADNVLSIYASASMKERGEYQCTFLKTRSSSGVGSKVFVRFDPISMRITNHEEGYHVDDGSSPSDGTELRKKVSQASNNDIINSIKGARTKPTAPTPDHDPVTGEIIEDKEEVPVQESLTERLARLQGRGAI